MKIDAAGLAQQLRELHVRGTPLVLANIWDAGGARAVVAAGFSVVATSSAAVAESLGFEDGQRAPVEEMLAATARIVNSVEVPVTVDIEAGYEMSPAQLVEALLAAGVHGCNIEDSNHRDGGLVNVSAQTAYIAAMRFFADQAGVPLVINARVDAFHFLMADPVAQRAGVPDAVERARRYLDAGADCVYPILLTDLDAISAFITGMADANVNLMCRVGEGRPFPSIAEATSLGAARLSVGGQLWRAQLSSLARLLDDLAAS